MMLGLVLAFADTQPAQQIEATSPGRYQLESGTIALSGDQTMPTIFRSDSQTGQVDYLVPMSTGSGGTIAVWNRTYTTTEARAVADTGK